MLRAPRPVVHPPPVTFQPWRPQAWSIVVVLAIAFGIAGGLGIGQFLVRGPLAPYEYHLWRWEADTLVDNLFARLGIGPDPDQAKGEDAIRNYFRLTTEIRGAQQSANPDGKAIDALIAERSKYENDVERYVEGLIDDAVTSAGLQRGLPLFNGVDITWPPVDFELTNPPSVLVRSPRNEIRRGGDTLLNPNISFGDIEKIEGETDDADTVSIVVPIGGLAAYPAIVNGDRSYDSLLDTASHEWVHHYLAFYPLGEQWHKGGQAYTLNETTADLAGHEIANLIRKAHPLTLPDGETGAAPPQPGQAAPTVDFNKEMRQLRLDVDALLAQGKVAEAEQLMEQKRQYLEQNGIYIRKLNQAYFAFYGTYAESSASSDPIGPKVRKVWDATQDVGAFLKLMRQVTSVKDLDTLLSALGQSPDADGPG